ncbi:Golgi-associated RAB2 interactor protein 1B-like isoform X1 [Paroedura picta]|uniref:Golgi-associated RAB2 interactor protein 1B-like isoform X1 n=1 Tax=Paroedura picta TaxID=143630 RepID=UPI0040572CD6
MAAGASDGKPAAGQKSAWEDGRLSQLLHSSDYNLFPHSAVFESDFVQVTKKGKWVDFSNMPTIVSVGVTSSDPCLPLPNVLLMARRKVLDKGFVEGDSKTPERPVAELNRLLPLRFVRLSVHRDAQRILRLQTVTRKVYYLQLHRDHPKAVFRLWSRLADILKRGLSTTPKDPAIRIQHSLVPSGSSPSGSSSAEPFSDAASPGRPASKQQGRKAPSGDAPAQPRARRREREGRLGPKRLPPQRAASLLGVHTVRKACATGEQGAPVHRAACGRPPTPPARAADFLAAAAEPALAPHLGHGGEEVAPSGLSSQARCPRLGPCRARRRRRQRLAREMQRVIHLSGWT